MEDILNIDWEAEFSNNQGDVQAQWDIFTSKFRSDLNTTMELACLIAGGRAFHSATEKARRPYRSRWYRGIVNRC